MITTLVAMCLATPAWQVEPVSAFLSTEPAPTASNIRRVVRQHPSEGSAEVPAGMILVPGGETTVGTYVDDVEKLASRDVSTMAQIMAETPRHTELVEPFYVDLTEVTNLQWKLFLDASGRAPSDTMVEFNWPGGKIPAGQENFPITNINYPEIRDFLEWSGKRLPTEFEWTRAARGDDERLFPWGDKADPRKAQTSLTGGNSPVETGSFPEGQSPFGVLNMGGNVFEWTESPFRAYDGYEPLKFKLGRKTTMVGPDFDSNQKVVKGASYMTARTFMRIDSRFGVSPGSSDYALGFRAARSVKPGVDALLHGYRRALPPQFAKKPLDYEDIFAREITLYDESLGAMTDYRFVAFAHRGKERGSPLSKLRKSSVDEPEALGIVVSSEALVMVDMPVLKVGEEERPYTLEPGEYTIAFKGKGESKAYKDRRREDRKSNRGKSSQDDDEAAAAAEPSNPERGAAVRWPGPDLKELLEDIDYPQDEDVLLFYNANSAVVAWQKAGEVRDEEVTPLEAAESNSGRDWALSFSLDQASRKAPRFGLSLRLHGEGL